MKDLLKDLLVSIVIVSIIGIGMVTATIKTLEVSLDIPTIIYCNPYTGPNDRNYFMRKQPLHNPALYKPSGNYRTHTYIKVINSCLEA